LGISLKVKKIDVDELNAQQKTMRLRQRRHQRLA